MNSRYDGVPYTALTYTTGGPNNYQYEVTSKGEIQRVDPTKSDTRAFNYSQQAGIRNDEVMHGGSDIAVFAKGPFSHLFHNVHEQSYVAYVIAYAAKIGPYSDRPSHGPHPNSASLTSVSLPLLTILTTYIIIL